jgi:predicted nuclease with TOPRIM domain
MQASPHLITSLTGESLGAGKDRELDDLRTQVAALEIEASDLERDARLKESELDRMKSRLADLAALAESDEDTELTTRLGSVYSDYVTKYMNLEFLLFELSRLNLL